ncbi:MAG: ABC transporter ATP-binding protein [Desulfarculus sp.]|jgi:branched-chain amino acid transport system ATP-binding protein|nr:MAG: ABC transporter ATP-binding protein [Desulfarculus sp.]
MSILQTKDIRHDFHGLAVLFGVDLEVAEGERRAIIGPNGAGKTTLFNLITGKYLPRDGAVLLDGRDITRRPVYWRARHGLARSFQITNIFRRLTVYQSLQAAVLSRRSIRLDFIHQVSRMTAVNQEVDQLLERIGLSEQAQVPGGMLAYGQQRALEIGLTLALRPRVILLDEPTAGMSGEETRHVVDLIKRVTEGMTLVIIEHDMEVVFGLADRITVLHYGAVLASGPKDEIQQDPKVKEAYLGEED